MTTPRAHRPRQREILVRLEAIDAEAAALRAELASLATTPASPEPNA